MRALLVGFGSIGRRHYEVLTSISKVSDVHVVTNQNLEDIRTYSSLEMVSNIDQYDYFLIASETRKHFEQLEWLCSRVSKKKIFCEKPLFEESKFLAPCDNEVFVGYVLRFHPLLQKMKIIVGEDKILNLNVSCGSYLPNWRSNIDYRESYSAKKEQGGGVLLDLSHELDYTNWIAGKLVDIKSFQTRASNLEIDSDDLVSMVAKTADGAVVNLSLDYFSKVSFRRLLLNTNEYTLELDLIANKLVQTFMSGEAEVHEVRGLEKNHLFTQMHQEILFSKSKAYVCDLMAALEVMQIIQTIQDENDE